MFAYIKNIAYYLPDKIEKNVDSRLTKKTGILKRHLTAPDETSGDMAVKAAEKLFADGLSKDSIEYVIFCTQTPDYLLPTTACIIQDRLQLPQSCGALDFNLGCSGYVYGLSLAKGLIESGQVSNVLLLTAESYSKHIQEENDNLRFLFGDAATATFIEGVDAPQSGIYGLVFGSDGSGYDKLIVTGRGARNGYRYDSSSILSMDGSAISEFALKVVPATVDEILLKTKCVKSDIDYYIFHQANKFMLDFLQVKCGLEQENYWNNVREYGNTVSNTIPIGLSEVLSANIPQTLHKVMLVGFGVGLSWGGCIVDMSLFDTSKEQASSFFG